MSTRERSYTINGVTRRLVVADEQTLAEMLREQLGLTGCKVGCDQAVCGACTVLVDGIPVTACACFAAMVEGATIETIEGLSPRGQLDAVQQAFVECGAVQCGFCTAGMIMSVHALLRRDANPDEATIRHWLEAHVCRCTGYSAILDAVRIAARRMAREAA
ncbi:(2Fe-2S)-binding protein [Rhodopila sp.]|uniref:(2Fe-2S)-binding protein n=1 Tax=Rhodopila sp. TaxID=2480087 RepID=UPI003D13C5E2